MAPLASDDCCQTAYGADTRIDQVVFDEADAELVFERHHHVEHAERIDITAVEQVGIALDVIGGDATFFGDVVDDEVLYGVVHGFNFEISDSR